jgi:hypothetical protein
VRFLLGTRCRAITFKKFCSLSEQNLLNCVASIARPDTNTKLTEAGTSTPAPDAKPVDCGLVEGDATVA